MKPASFGVLPPTLYVKELKKMGKTTVNLKFFLVRFSVSLSLSLSLSLSSEGKLNMLVYSKTKRSLSCRGR